MITGYNTDVDFQGRVYHVQTEDRGRTQPVVESLVYCGGEIIASRRTPYAEKLDAGHCSEEIVQGIVDEQHQRLIREIRNGKFDTDHLKPFGYSVVTNRSFNEVVLDFLDNHLPLEAIQLKVAGPKTLRAGTSTVLRFEVRERNTGRPVGGVEVRVLADGVVSSVPPIFDGTTDGQGRLEVSLRLPAAGATAILCRAVAGDHVAEVRRPLSPHTAGSPNTPVVSQV